MKTVPFSLCLSLALSGIVFASAPAPAATFHVTESWSVTLEYEDFDDGITRTDQFSGQQTGTFQVNGGEFQIIDRIGVPWSAPGQDLALKNRALSFDGSKYDINGGYVFAPGFLGGRAYGLVFLGCFAVKVPLIFGEVPAFYRYETYSGRGPPSEIKGGGNMIGSSLKAYVSSTLSLTEVVGAPAISQQPRSQTAYEGQNVTFNVEAGGKGPLGYFWRKGSTVLPRANDSSLTITNVQFADAGGYSVIVSNAGGKVTSATAQLTVKVPPPPWFEGWESAALGSHYLSTNDQSTVITGDKKYWVVGDTVSIAGDCGPPLNHADIVLENGRKLLKLTSVASDSGCADNIGVSIDSRTSASLPIPLLPSVQISFFEQGLIVDPHWNGFFNCVGPPCGDTVNLTVVDNLGNHVVYIFQRATNYVEHLGIGYVEIFLDPAGGSFTRDLFADFARIAGADSVGTTIEGVSFGIAAEGWAALDDLRIGSTSTNSDRVKPTVAIASPAAGTRVNNSVVTVQGTARDNSGVAVVEYRLENVGGVGAYQPAIGSLQWSAVVSGLMPGTNTVRVRARDVVGNLSSEAARSVVFVVASPLMLTVGPGGKVTGATNRQLLEVGGSYKLTAMASNGFRFTGWSGGIVSTNAVLTFLMPSNLIVQANFADAQRPTVAITLPANNSRISNAVATVWGTASDNAGVTAVLLQLNGEPFVPAAGTTSWVATVTLVPGTNRFVVKSVDTAGHESLLASNRFVFVPSSPLTLVVRAGGKVSGATNGQLLALGSNYTLTAMASNGFVFSNWTDGGGVEITNNPTNKFVMRSNLVLIANFVPNPFIPTKGTYNGLFFDTNGVLHESSGFFTATVTDKGMFTGNLQSNGKRLPLSGQFDLEGRASRTVPRPGTNALMLELQLDVTDGTDKITGIISNGTWTASLTADRAVFNARTNPATRFVGKYTLIVPGSTNGMVSPDGDGFGTITVDAGGMVAFTGSLADGTPATQRVPLSKNGEWPLYVSLYSGRGSVLSWVTFTNRPSDDLHGLLSWIKPSLPLAKYYPMGFTNQTLLEGSIYVPPGTNRVLNLTNGVVVLSGGSLNQSSTNEVVLGANNKVTNLSSNKLTLTIVPATGLFSGSVTPVGSPKTIPIKGVSLQKQNFGSGYFLGTNRSGQVWFGPPE